MPDGLCASVVPPPIPSGGVALANRDLLEQLSLWTHTHFGMTFGADRMELFSARVTQVVVECGTSLENLVASAVRGDRATSVALAEALSTNHTYFFREPEVLEIFRTRVLPELRKHREARIWSAACSSGDEPYSLAMIGVDEWGADEAKQKLSVLGTDISPRMVADAEVGLYGSRHVSVVRPETLRKHFHAAGLGQLVVAPEVKALCQFRRLNLTAHGWPFQRGFHAIFLRNVLYYFDAESQRQVLEACWEHALPNAYLFTSLTEPLHEIRTRWHQIEPAVYRKVV